MIVISDSVEIHTTPEAIWDFFRHIEENYTQWHEEHVRFSWIRGKPLEKGSVGCFEEYLHGKLHRMKVEFTQIVPMKLIEFRATNPILRIFYPKSSIAIEKKGDGCIVTASICIRGDLFLSLSKRFFARGRQVEQHQREEGENLKRILESRNRAGGT